MILECPRCRSRYDVGARPVGTRVRCRCGETFAVDRPSESAEVLKCPRCGAACRPDGASCDYCQASLALVFCPRCFGRVFQGSSHCQHCGAEVHVPATAANRLTPRLCPRCPREGAPRLMAHVVDGTLLDECHVCGGVWIDAAAFEAVVRDRQQQAAIIQNGQLAVHGKDAGVHPDQLPNIHYIRCPDCGQLMNRQNFGKSSGVIVDVCKPHGVWFDRDELGQCIQFILSGRLEEARKRELRELEHQAGRPRGALPDLDAKGPYRGTADGETHPRFGGVIAWLLDLLNVDVDLGD